VLSWRRIIATPTPRFLIKACTLGALIALPWWLLNFRYALSYAGYARNFIRHSLGSPGIATSVAWLRLIAEGGLGLPLTILLSTMLIFLLLIVSSKRGHEIKIAQKTAMVICFLTPLPLVMAP